jgi:hypothetical protein
MASGRLAALGVNAATNTTATQKKAAARRKENTLRILLKSYAEGPSAQTISQSVVSPRFTKVVGMRWDAPVPTTLDRITGLTLIGKAISPLSAIRSVIR